MSHSEHSPPLITASTPLEHVFFSDLHDDERSTLEKALTWKSYAAGHIFYEPDDRGAQLFVLRQGRVRIYKLSLEGRGLTLLQLEAGAIFGEMALSEAWHHDSFAEAVTDCIVGSITRDDLRRIMIEHSSLAIRFMHIMTARLRVMERKLADIAFKSVPQRLAALLLNQIPSSRQPAEAAPTVVRYTHQQLAEMIGSYRETVTKTIGEFREAGLIRIEEDVITLTNIAGLKALIGATR